MWHSKHATSQEAWEYINEWLATNEKLIIDSGGLRSGSNMISYDHFLEIHKLWVDPKFDFGNAFGYKIQKWNKLISNYIDFDFLDIAKSRVREREMKKARNYAIEFKFANKHNSGHSCLLTLVFSRRYSHDNPVVIMNIRSSEVTKRLLMDFLLVERIVDYIYGKKHSASLKVFCAHMYLNGESFTMYHTHKNLRELLDPNRSELEKKIIDLVNKFETTNPDDVKYKVHRRAVKRLNKLDTPKLLARDLYLK